MKEIGGYLELEKNFGKEYHNGISFNSSRNALQYIIRKRKINKIYVQYYLCLVIEETLKNENVHIEYYHIDDKFLPILDNYDNNSFIYLVNYFGLLSLKTISSFSKKYNMKVILDNTHAFFMRNVPKVDTIYNCRKYFGVPDGAYLLTDLKYNDEYPLASSMSRIKHLFGRCEDTASSYYKDFVEADATLDNCDIEMMSKITHNMLKSIEYEKIRKKRISNFQVLDESLHKFNKLSFDKDIKCNYMYPLLIDNGNIVKKRLIENKIFVQTLWPGLNKFDLNDFEKNIFNNLVLLPIDQRYDREDMNYIIDIIKEKIK